MTRTAKQKWPELRRQVGPWLALFLGNIVATGWLYSLVEKVGPIEGPWWGIVTGSTTGYGDLYPQSTAGRGIAAYLILSSIVIDRVMSAKIVTVMVEEPNLYSHLEQEREEVKSDLILALLARLAERNHGLYLTELHELRPVHSRGASRRGRRGGRVPGLMLHLISDLLELDGLRLQYRALGLDGGSGSLNALIESDPRQRRWRYVAALEFGKAGFLVEEIHYALEVVSDILTPHVAPPEAAQRLVEDTAQMVAMVCVPAGLRGDQILWARRIVQVVTEWNELAA